MCRRGLTGDDAIRELSGRDCTMDRSIPSIHYCCWRSSPDPARNDGHACTLTSATAPAEPDRPAVTKPRTLDRRRVTSDALTRTPPTGSSTNRSLLISVTPLSTRTRGHRGRALAGSDRYSLRVVNPVRRALPASQRCSWQTTRRCATGSRTQYRPGDLEQHAADKSRAVIPPAGCESSASAAARFSLPNCPDRYSTNAGGAERRSPHRPMPRARATRRIRLG